MTNQILAEIGAVSNAGDTINGNLIVLGTVTSSNPVFGTKAVATNTAVGASTILAATVLNNDAILRSGSVANYTDTLDTAANFMSAIPNAVVGNSFRFRIVNTVAFVDTVAAGAGITLSGTTAIAASTWRDFVGVVTNVTAPAITVYGIGSGPL